jgi:hypothetical protein
MTPAFAVGVEEFVTAISRYILLEIFAVRRVCSAAEGCCR